MSAIRKFFIYTFLVGIFTILTPSEKSLAAPVQTDPEETLMIVQQAISNSDTRLISQFTSLYTELSILGETTMYSRAQTAYILKEFFRDHPPERFAFQHKLRVGQDWFVYGKYANRGRQSPFRLEMTMHWNGHQFEIKSISIKRLNER